MKYLIRGEAAALNSVEFIVNNTSGGQIERVSMFEGGGLKVTCPFELGELLAKVHQVAPKSFVMAEAA